MSQDPEKQVRPDIVAMEAYTPIQPYDVLSAQLGRQAEDIVKLDANENPYGPAPAARSALTSEPWLHIYPDPESTRLREAIAVFHGLPTDRILAGMGADELIDLVLRVILSPGDTVLNCPPTFGMYAFSTAVNMGHLLEVPRSAAFAIDVKSIAAAVASEPRTKVLFICSPNNPDGSLVADADLRTLLDLPVVVILDEAYVEFAEASGYQSKLKWALDYDNLVVLRTFSKLAGLAGLRVGYGVFPDWLLPHLWKIKQPYNVNVAASSAAIASLEEVDWMLENVRLIVTERERMIARLEQFEYLQAFPSQSNFVLFRVSDRSAKELKQALAQEGVLVRHFDKPGLENCIRISVGRPYDTDRLITAMQKVSNHD